MKYYHYFKPMALGYRFGLALKVLWSELSFVFQSWPLPNNFSNFSPPISAGVCVGRRACVQHGATLRQP